MIDLRPPRGARAQPSGAPPGSTTTYGRRRLIPAWILGPIVVAVAVALIAVGIKASYGGYASHYELTVNLSRAGQQLELGSDVREHGVVIGHVNSIRLIDRQVVVGLQIDRQYHVPSTAEAFVDLKTLLGAKFVDLRSPAYRGPFLADGAQVREGTVGPELEDVLASGTQVLDAIRPADAATVVSTLAQAAQGHGQDVARGIDANAQLSTLFAQTLTPQEQSLHDFQVLFGHLANSGPVLNALADAVNQGVPVYASAKAQAELDRVLRDIVPFSNNLGDLLIVQRPQWDRLITAGDVVLGTIAGRPGGLQDLVQGLARYVFKLSGPPAAMRDGSAAAGFVDFIGGDSMKLTVTQICIALPTPIRVHIPLCTGTA